VDVDPFAFRPLTQQLVFPYRRRADGSMELIPWPDIEDRLPATAAYLRKHEKALRARERGAMDTATWYAFGRTQSLGLHDAPKLGVAATVTNLEVAIDPSGGTYFHNVRVNGILPAPDGPSLWVLLVLLNSSALDYLFRRGAAEHANGYYAANKQFIAPLPIRVPGAADATDIEELGRSLHETAAAVMAERESFLQWLGDLVGARIRDLSGWTRIAAYEDADVADLIEALRRNTVRMRADPTSRTFHETLTRAHAESRERLANLHSTLERTRRDAEEGVGDLYELTVAQRRLIAEDSPPRLPR
jgi:hypothetical protein